LLEISVGCKDYKNRPQQCKDYICEWIVDENIPDDFIPQNKDVIIMLSTIDDIWYARAVKAGQNIDQETLDWYIDYYINTRMMNFWFEKDGINYVVGSDNFVNKTQRMGYGTIRYDYK
jgi:hypothetical protein